MEMHNEAILVTKGQAVTRTGETIALAGEPTSQWYLPVMPWDDECSHGDLNQTVSELRVARREIVAMARKKKQASKKAKPRKPKTLKLAPAALAVFNSLPDEVKQAQFGTLYAEEG